MFLICEIHGPMVSCQTVNILEGYMGPFSACMQVYIRSCILLVYVIF